jgi:hypothetical protein
MNLNDWRGELLGKKETSSLDEMTPSNHQL